MNLKMNTRSQNFCLPQVSGGSGGRRGSKATERGECVTSPLPHHGDFAFWGFKLTDLVHTFGEFVGILPIINEKEKTHSQNMCLPQVGDGRRGSEATERGRGRDARGGIFAFWEPEESDLVHTFGGFFEYCPMHIREFH